MVFIIEKYFSEFSVFPDTDISFLPSPARIPYEAAAARIYLSYRCISEVSLSRILLVLRKRPDARS